MSYVRKLGASALVVAAAFAVAFAVLVSSTSTQTAEAADVPVADADNAGTAAPGDKVQFTVTAELAQLTITGSAEGVGGSFDANDGQTISCADSTSCDKDGADDGSVQVDLNVDADSGEGYILVEVKRLGIASPTTVTKVVTVSKANLVGSLAIKAVSKTIAADDDDATAPTVQVPGVNATLISVNVKNAASTPAGLNTQSVTLITTLGTISCNGTDFTQACSVNTAASTADTPGVDTGEDGWATVILRGSGVEGTATVTATLGSLTDTVDVTFYGEAKNLTAEPEQGSVEIGGSVFVVLTVTDGAGNPVSGQVIEPITTGSTKEVVGPNDDAVPVVTEKDTAGDSAANPAVPAGRGYSMDKPAAGKAAAIPACGDDNAHVGADAATYDELFGADDAAGTDDAGEGTNDKGQCVVHVTAPEDTTDATKNATRGEHTLNFAIGTIKASATIEVAGKPSSITTDAPAMVDAASVTEITVSVWDDEDVLVGITDVRVRKVGGDGLIEDQGDGGSEMTSDGQSKFTFIAPSAVGSSEILITAGDAETRVTLQIGEQPEDPPPPPPPAPSFNKTPSATGFTLVSFSGGSIDDLAGVLAAECGDGGRAYATDYQGNYVSYIPSAPAVVNAAFEALYADGIPANEALLVGGCGG